MYPDVAKSSYCSVVTSSLTTLLFDTEEMYRLPSGPNSMCLGEDNPENAAFTNSWVMLVLSVTVTEFVYSSTDNPLGSDCSLVNSPM